MVLGGSRPSQEICTGNEKFAARPNLERLDHGFARTHSHCPSGIRGLERFGARMGTIKEVEP